MFLSFFLKQAELQENLEARGERMGGVQTHKRMVASLEKQIAVQEKKLEQVRHVQIFFTNIILFEEWICWECGFSWVFTAYLSTVSNLNNQIMKPESDIMDGRHQAASLADFVFSPAPLESLFAGYSAAGSSLEQFVVVFSDGPYKSYARKRHRK